MKRDFSFEHFTRYQKELLDLEKEKALHGIMHDKEHTIIASDIDPTMIAIAKDNARNA